AARRARSRTFLYPRSNADGRINARAVAPLDILARCAGDCDAFSGLLGILRARRNLDNRRPDADTNAAARAILWGSGRSCDGLQVVGDVSQLTGEWGA